MEDYIIISVLGIPLAFPIQPDLQTHLSAGLQEYETQMDIEIDFSEHKRDTKMLTVMIILISDPGQGGIRLEDKTHLSAAQRV